MLKRLLNETNRIIKIHPYSKASRRLNFEILKVILAKEEIQLKPFNELNQIDGEDTACLVYLDELSTQDKEIVPLIAEQGVYMFVVTEENIANDFTACITSAGIVINVIELEEKKFWDRLCSIDLGKTVLVKSDKYRDSDAEIDIDEILGAFESVIYIEGDKDISRVKQIEDKLKEQNNKIVYFTDHYLDNTEDVVTNGAEFGYIFRIED